MISNFNILKKLGNYSHSYQIILFLGEGAFSQVFLVKRLSDGELYALKKVIY